MSKRINLREFQQNLIDQLQKENLSAARVSTLGVQVAGKNLLVDMVDIAEVLQLPPLTAVPFTKAWFRGVANVRGNLYSVVDVASYQLNGKASGGVNNRILLVAGQFKFNVALLVDVVLGLRDARNWRQNEAADQIEYQDEQGARWHKLDIPDLLEQADFLQIGS